MKRIWITGASSGIGEALAYAFAETGAHLILSARNEDELNRVARGCQMAASVLVVPLDLGNHASLAPTAQKVINNSGKIDILINNGGISQRSRALETALEVDKRLMDINYFGTIALTRAVLPSMLLHQLGTIVTITSLTGKFGTPFRSSYAASKHALHGFFDSLRAELGDGSPIRITLICPGYVRTNISKNALVGDGNKQGTMDVATDNGMDPNVLARKIISAINAGKEEVYFGGKEVLGVYLNRFFPALFRKIIRSAKVV